MKAKIHHIYHSGTAVETDNKLLIFDFYRDIKNRDINEIFPEFKNKEIFIFVSHAHGDHFNREILKWYEYNQDIKFIFSSDISINSEKDFYYFLNKDQELKLQNIYIKTLGSTDRGVSFLVKIEDICLFHAGDLNWWHWKSFSQDDLKKEEEQFKNEIDKLQKEAIDIAFIPVDPRLDEYYYLAAEYFVEKINPAFLIPIHFGDKYQVTEKLKEKLADISTEIPVIKKNKETLLFEYQK